jgi:hypothetical protein
MGPEFSPLVASVCVCSEALGPGRICRLSFAAKDAGTSNMDWSPLAGGGLVLGQRQLHWRLPACGQDQPVLRQNDIPQSDIEPAGDPNSETGSLHPEIGPTSGPG